MSPTLCQLAVTNDTGAVGAAVEAGALLGVLRVLAATTSSSAGGGSGGGDPLPEQLRVLATSLLLRVSRASAYREPLAAFVPMPLLMVRQFVMYCNALPPCMWWLA